MKSTIISLDKEREALNAEKSVWKKVLTIAAGSIFLAGMAQIAIPLPFNPVPVSMQTFGVMLLALTLGKKEALCAVLAYLMQATLGLPVLAGGAVQPLWAISPTAGYLIGFVAAVFVSSSLLEMKQNRSFLWTMTALFAGEAVIYILGATVLSFFVGFENAILLGVVPFVVGSVLKLIAAASLEKPIDFVKRFFI
ncbi:biotin transporter BioY [Estrella lausannensis]|uniref:Biotin transporter n=1 Tax=Estrella lausannensis TaxID=483423 RepID=A0A0H5DQJ1_9BACT|nr:biotin transporter BioY [Estrella lausannensis]CRX38348.1 putative biotin transporter BioY [Estrella lausannensis]